jgi:hypothetical protein
MAESAGLAHPSISSLRPTTANEVLYDGRATEVNSGRDCRLRVVARWLPSQGVRWTTHFPEPGPNAWSAAAEVRFRLKARGAYSGQEVVGQARDSASGWMDGAEVVGRTEVAVPAVLVRWVNLGNVGQGNWLEAIAGDGTRRHWAGRGVWRVGEWTMAVDARPDLGAVIETLKNTGKYAVTHLGTLHRIDTRPFTAKECEPVLRAYQLASSFVLGRFTCPALAEARDDDGRLVWREWGARLADPLGGVDAWWDWTAAPMADPVRLLGERLLDPKRGRVARHLAQSYVASNRGGFVEQRITIAFAALELLSWQRAVLEGGADPKKHQDKNADWRLRAMLKKAKIPISPIPAHLPALKALPRTKATATRPRRWPKFGTASRTRRCWRISTTEIDFSSRPGGSRPLSGAADPPLDRLQRAHRRSNQAGLATGRCGAMGSMTRPGRPGSRLMQRPLRVKPQ